jgi:hypothetical protein
MCGYFIGDLMKCRAWKECVFVPAVRCDGEGILLHSGTVFGDGEGAANGGVGGVCVGPGEVDGGDAFEGVLGRNGAGAGGIGLRGELEEDGTGDE